MLLWALGMVWIGSEVKAQPPPRADEEFYTPTCQPRPTGSQRSQWRYGLLSSRQCQIDMLRTGLAAGSLNYTEVSVRAQEIRWYYTARAGRQQNWMDGSTAVTVFGAAGYLAAQGTPALTQTYWGAIALVPLVVTQFNAYEPTRDLFYGGAIGVDLIAKRYDQIYWASRNLAALTQGNALSRKANDACIAIGLEIQVVNAQDWKGKAEDRKALLSDLEAARNACQQMDRRRSYLSVLQSSSQIYVSVDAQASSSQLSHLFARDILAFDAIMEHNDHNLRFGPAETLSAIAASPFQLASTLLTGADGKKAIDGLKTQSAFNNMELKLSDVVLPVPPTQSIDVGQIAISGPALGRQHLEGRKSDDPAARAVNQTLSVLQDAIPSINDGIYELSSREAWAGLYRQAVAANRLTFNYDATKSEATVAVGPPSAPATPLAQVGGDKK